MLAIGGKSRHNGRGFNPARVPGSNSTAQQQVNGDTFSLLGSQQRRVYVDQVSMTATSNSYLKGERIVKSYEDANYSRALEEAFLVQKSGLSHAT